MTHVTCEVENGIATITLARPEVMNVFSDRMEAELLSSFERCNEDDEVRVIIMTGQGSAFCAGMDLSKSPSPFIAWRESQSAPEGSRVGADHNGMTIRRDGGGRVALAIFASLKPVIVAFNGPAVGVGVTMALAADLRLASNAARFGFVFNRRGVVPEACSSWFLPRLVGMQTALDWVLTGRVFGADEALSRGLLHSVHPPDELYPAAQALAREIADHTSAVSTAITRQLFWQMQTASHPMDAHQLETAALNARGVSADAGEGIASFIEKRPATFTDRVSEHVSELIGDPEAPPFMSACS